MQLYIGKNGEQLGPFDVDATMRGLASNGISLDDLAWADGEAAWTPLSEFAAKKGIVLKPDVPIVAATSPPPIIGSGKPSTLACPKCQSEHVQKISIIVSSGTTNTVSNSKVSGTVYGPGVLGNVGGQKTTFSTSQTELAEEFSEQLFKESPLTGVLASAALAGSVASGFYASKLFHSTTWGWAVGIGMFVLCAFVIAGIKPSKRSVQLERWRNQGCYCHRCGHKFIPGSDEIYISAELPHT